MKKSQFIVFLTIVLSVYTLVNYYIYITGLNSLPPGLKTVYSFIFLFLFLSYIAGRFLERKFLNSLSAFFVWVGSFWLAAMVYFLFFTVLIDLAQLVNLIFKIFPGNFYSEKNNFLFFIAVNSAVFLIVAAGFINAKSPALKTIKLAINKPAGKLKTLKIAAASDLHLGTIINRGRLKDIVEKINLLNPDIILLPGDIVDEDIGPVIKQNAGELLRELSSKYGVYAVTGNHEYIGGVEPAVKYLQDHGIKLLRDEVLLIENSFYIAGREDRSSRGFAGIKRKSLHEILSGINSSLPVILMDHQPAKLNEAEENGVDLQLSGHTHHGQLWPFNYITKKVYEVSRGYKQKGNTHYYISSGAGTWGPPVRTGSRPEILLIEISFKG